MSASLFCNTPNWGLHECYDVSVGGWVGVCIKVECLSWLGCAPLPLTPNAFLAGPCRWDRIGGGVVPGKSKAQCFKRFKELRDSLRAKKAAAGEAPDADE